MTIQVRDGQSLYDIALQYYGDITGYWWLLEDNGLTVESEIEPGQELTIREGVIQERAIFFRDGNREINNSDDFILTETTKPIAIKIVEVRNEKDGNDGFVRVEITGGKAPYGYLWSNGARSKNLLNAIAGTYTLTVEDARGSQKQITVTVGTNNVDDWLAETGSGLFIITSQGDKIRINTNNI